MLFLKFSSPLSHITHVSWDNPLASNDSIQDHSSPNTVRRRTLFRVRALSNYPGDCTSSLGCAGIKSREGHTLSRELTWPGSEVKLVECLIDLDTWLSVASKQVVLEQLGNCFLTRSQERRCIANVDILRLKPLQRKPRAKDSLTEEIRTAPSRPCRI